MKARDKLESERKRLAEELSTLLDEADMRKMDFRDFSVKKKVRYRITGWKWEQLKSLFGEDAVKDMEVRGVNRIKLGEGKD